MESEADMQIAVVHQGRRLLQNSTISPMNTTDNTLHCNSVLYEFDICTAVVCALCFVLGVIYTFFGYRFFKVLAFFTGLLFGSLMVYLICLDVGVTALPPAGVIGIAAGAGVICGIITLLVRYINLFMTGLHYGMGLGLIILLFVNLIISPFSHRAIAAAIIAVFGLTFAFLALKFQKVLAIGGTSILGSALMVVALDYFIEKFILVDVYWDILRGLAPARPLCWFSWAIFACWPFCVLIGAFIQTTVTGHGLDHSTVVHGNHVRKLDLNKIRAALYQDSQVLRYTDLYKARRIKGDQILQSYTPDIKDRSLTLTCKSDGTGHDSANTTMTQLP